MTHTGTQQTENNKCSHCGKAFNSAQELREHEEKCQGSASTEKAAAPTAKEVKTDMHVEDRFEATDH